MYTVHYTAKSWNEYIRPLSLKLCKVAYILQTPLYTLHSKICTKYIFLLLAFLHLSIDSKKTNCDCTSWYMLLIDNEWDFGCLQPISHIKHFGEIRCFKEPKFFYAVQAPDTQKLNLTYSTLDLKWAVTPPIT